MKRSYPNQTLLAAAEAIADLYCKGWDTVGELDMKR
jgi:hypothetical protein